MANRASRERVDHLAVAHEGEIVPGALAAELRPLVQIAAHAGAVGRAAGADAARCQK